VAGYWQRWIYWSGRGNDRTGFQKSGSTRPKTQHIAIWG
jgi:hypothetical protein